MDQRGRSSVGRAPALQAGGRRFDPVRLHQFTGGQDGADRSRPCCLQTFRTLDKEFSSSKFRFLDDVWAGVVAASRRKANRCLLFVIVNMMLSGLHVRSVALRDLRIASDRLGM
jgi:hypothetical protein